jgi:hypothetical protein
MDIKLLLCQNLTQQEDKTKMAWGGGEGEGGGNCAVPPFDLQRLWCQHLQLRRLRRMYRKISAAPMLSSFDWSLLVFDLILNRRKWWTLFNR